jgi:hypothetical protein
VFNNSHIQLVSSFSLTQSTSTHNVSFHSSLLPSSGSVGWDSAPIQRLGILGYFAFLALCLLDPHSECAPHLPKVLCQFCHAWA